MKTPRQTARAAAGRGAALRLLGLAALGAVLLSACEAHRRLENEMAVGMSDPERRHPIGFTARHESLDVEVPPNTEGLSLNQRVDVTRFLHRYRREASGRLIVSVPEGGRGQPAIAHALQGIQQQIAEAGIDYRIVRGARGLRASGAAGIRLAYDRPVAVPPVCDHWEEDVGRNEARIPYPNWGCATQRNTAVMVGNARDLQQPQAEDPRSGERRGVTWSAYVGTPTGGGGGGGDSGESSKKAAPAAKK